MEQIKKVAKIDSISWVLPSLWLLSYFLPFVFLSVVTHLLKDYEASGLAMILLVLGPFALGLFGSIWSITRASLSPILSVLLTIATFVAFLIGFVVFWLVLTMLYGVVAT